MYVRSLRPFTKLAAANHNTKEASVAGRVLRTPEKIWSSNILSCLDINSVTLKTFFTESKNIIDWNSRRVADSAGSSRPLKSYSVFCF